MENNPQCGVCGGNLFDGDGIPARSYAILPGIKENIMTIFHVTIETFNKTELPKEVGYITGADMIIKNDVFKNFHGFDEDFFMYFEETELEFRLAKAGFKIYSIPQANIVHFESKSHNSNENKIRNYMKSRKLYFSKTHSWLYRKITNGLFLTYLITSLLLCVIMRNKNKIRVLSIKLKYFIFKKV
jgi:GT2 family glycosyltransferase